MSSRSSRPSRSMSSRPSRPSCPMLDPPLPATRRIAPSRSRPSLERTGTAAAGGAPGRVAARPGSAPRPAVRQALAPLPPGAGAAGAAGGGASTLSAGGICCAPGGWAGADAAGALAVSGRPDCRRLPVYVVTSTPTAATPAIAPTEHPWREQPGQHGGRDEHPPRPGRRRRRRRAARTRPRAPARSAHRPSGTRTGRRTRWPAPASWPGRPPLVSSAAIGPVLSSPLSSRSASAWLSRSGRRTCRRVIGARPRAGSPPAPTRRPSCAAPADGPAGATHGARRRAPHRPVCRAPHLRHCVQPDDRPQQHRLGLVGRQRRDERYRVSGRDRVERRRGGVVRAGYPGQHLDTVPGRRLAPVAQQVQRPVAGDPGRPTAEPVDVAGEAAHVAGDLQPRLGRRVVGLAADQCGGVAMQPGRHRAVQRDEPRFVAGLRPGQRVGKGRVVRIGPVAGGVGRWTRRPVGPLTDGRDTRRCLDQIIEARLVNGVRGAGRWKAGSVASAEAVPPP